MKVNDWRRWLIVSYDPRKIMPIFGPHSRKKMGTLHATEGHVSDSPNQEDSILSKK